MSRVSLFVISVFLSPSIAVAATNIDGAVQDICKCGFPPSQSCIDRLAPKYPEIDNDPNLQQIVMSEAQRTCGVGSAGASESAIQALIGNQNLDVSKLPGSTAQELGGLTKIVSATTDCSTELFKIDVPENWQCRKQNKNARDVTLYTNNNQLNVSLGNSQGMTSCSILPNCTSESVRLSGKFDTTQFTNPLAAGLVEYAGTFKADGAFKLTITAMSKPTNEQLKDIEAILDSFEKQ